MMRLLAGGDGVGGGDRGRNLIGGDDHGSGGAAQEDEGETEEGAGKRTQMGYEPQVSQD